MAQANEPDAWCEGFLITIQKKDGEPIDFGAAVTTYDITGGDKDFSQIANGKGGRIKKFEAQTPYEITLEAYSTEVGSNTNATTPVIGKGFADLLTTPDPSAVLDVSEIMSLSADHTRDEYMLAIAETTSTSATSAIAASVEGDRIERDIFKNGHFVSYVSSKTDGIRKHTIKYKVTAFDKAGSSNITQDSSDGSTTIVVPAVTYVTA
jgi:hypothetical protein